MMTEEQKAAQSEKMKAAWVRRKAEKETPHADTALQEALAKAPINAVVERAKHIDIEFQDDIVPKGSQPNSILIMVDWNNTPMPQAQTFYANLKKEFESAGRILNARSNARTSGFTCFMCNKHFDGNPGFTDYSYTDVATGLSPRVDCCGELCVINYHKKRIDDRLANNLRIGQEERGE